LSIFLANNATVDDLGAAQKQPAIISFISYWES